LKQQTGESTHAHGRNESIEVKSLVIVDLDGTLADGKHREHHLHPKEKRDWDAYYEKCGLDAPHEDVIQVVNSLQASGYIIIIITGRREQTRPATEQWLRHYGVCYDVLIMRPVGCHTDDHIWKVEMISLVGPQNILVVIEDRNRIVSEMRARGLRVIQVAEGNF
jgi:hypothetical protein